MGIAWGQHGIDFGVEELFYFERDATTIESHMCR